MRNKFAQDFQLILANPERAHVVATIFPDSPAPKAGIKDFEGFWIPALCFAAAGKTPFARKGIFQYR
jgi:hypothetical protein